jgi:hypothetical protein
MTCEDCGGEKSWTGFVIPHKLCRCGTPKTPRVAHELKTLNPHFGECWCGRKCAEIRKNDRNFAVGDLVELREYDAIAEKYLGRSFCVRITHILRAEDGPFGLQDGYVMLSFKPSDKTVDG